MIALERRVLPLLLGAALAGCDAGPAPERAERIRLGDTLVVSSRAPSHPDTAVLVELARIGLAEGPEERVLAGVTAFAALPDGRVAIADGAGLRLFSGDGEFLERIGRTGRGPGEVRYVVGLDAADDGTLLAMDLVNRRTKVYRLTTGELDHWPMPDGMPGYGRGSVVATDDGGAIVAYAPWIPGDGAPPSYPRPVFLRLDSAGTVVDTLVVEARLAEGCAPTTSHWWSGWHEDLREPYVPKVKWAVSRAGALAAGCPADYRIEVRRPDGAVTRMTRSYEPVPVSSAERDAFVEALEWDGRDEGWSWTGDPPPSEKPAYQRLVFARDGRLWVWPARPSVRREVPEDARPQGAPAAVYIEETSGAFDVFAATGEHLGAVRLPDDVPYSPFPGSADPYIRGDTVWMVAYDELEVPYVVRYRVAWPGTGAAAR